MYLILLEFHLIKGAPLKVLSLVKDTVSSVWVRPNKGMLESFLSGEQQETRVTGYFVLFRVVENQSQRISFFF